MEFPSFIACPRCGDRVPVTARFCGNCGLKMTAATQGPQSFSVPPAGLVYTPPEASRRNSPAVSLAEPGQRATINPAPDGSSAQAPQQASAPGASFPEPPGLAPERAIVLSINRSPAESRINLPLVKVEQVETRLPALPESRAVTPAQPREAPNVSRSVPSIVSQRQPDGKGAPLPRNPKLVRRRVISSSVAAVLVVVIAAAAAWWLLAPAKDPALIVLTQLAPFSTNTLAAASLSLQPGWSAADGSQVASDADQISALALPPQPVGAAASIAKETPSPLASRAQTLNGLGQTQMGIKTPMDVSIASNTRYVVEAVDGGFQIIDTKGDVLSRGFAQLFKSVLQQSGDVFGEPRVLFDPTGQHWVLVVNEITINSGNIVASYFDVAISLTDSPLDRWRISQIRTQTDDYGKCNWADDPQLGSNVWGFFITGSIFDCGADGALQGVTLWELPKARFGEGKEEFLLGGTRFTNRGQPLLSLVPAVEAGSTATEWLVGNDAGEATYADFGNTSENLHLWAIEPTSTSNQALPYRTMQLDSPYADPPQALQPPLNQQVSQPAPRLSTGDARMASAQFINGHLYIAFTTAVNWDNDPFTRSGIYWIDLTPSFSSRTNSVSAQVAQAGILGLPEAYLFSPVLVADAEGNVFLSAQISSSSRDPGIIYTSRQSSDPLNQMGQGNTLVVLQTGAKPFGEHWGDYVGGSLVVFDRKRASPMLWMVAPVIDPGAQSDQITSNWHTRMWEFDTGGDAVQNIV